MSDSKVLLNNNVSKVFAILVLKNDGSRLYCKYYTKICPTQLLYVSEGNLSDLDTQKTFEKNLFEKSKKLTISKTLNVNENEIFTYSQFNILFKNLGDIFIFVLGDYDENELLLNEIINAIYESLSFFTKGIVSKKTVSENFENLILVVDEIIDEGIIITTDPATVVARATMKDTEPIQLNNTDTGFSAALNLAKSSIAKSLNL